MAALHIKALICIVIIIAAVLVAEAAPLSCSTVIATFGGCIQYLAGAPLNNCCAGLKGLYNRAKTSADRQTLCACLKKTLRSSSYGGAALARAAGLGKTCNIDIPYKISPSADCAKVTLDILFGGKHADFS